MTRAMRLMFALVLAMQAPAALAGRRVEPDLVERAEIEPDSAESDHVIDLRHITKLSTAKHRSNGKRGRK